MIHSFEVHAGWLNTTERIGVCYIERSRGNEVISFSFDELWLAGHPGFVMDPDITTALGRQYPPSDKRCFGFLSDTAPDRWGRKLMVRREAVDAKEAGRPRRTLMESDYILGVNDPGRIGALRYYDPENDVYLSERSIMAAPPIEKLRTLENASLNMENNDEAESRWVKDLVDPGSSLGGARPKANVIDENGNLWIAKFPSKNDKVDVGAWEMTVHELAVKCGLRVPEARIMKLSSYGSTFLSKRFDRNKDARIHFASAMTMLGQTDDSDEDIGYVDIASVIEEICVHPEEDLHELWDRMVFNILVSNTDDHLRNHGFLLLPSGWALSPGYDINPGVDKEELALAILNGHLKDTHEAIEAAPFFRLTGEEAYDRLEIMKERIEKNWRYEASRFGISRSEQNHMAAAFA